MTKKLRRACLFAFGMLLVALGSATGSAEQDAEYRPPTPGSVFIYQATRYWPSKFSQKITRTILSDQSDFEGIPAYRVKVDTLDYTESKTWDVRAIVEVIRAEDGNAMARLDANGEILELIPPHESDYS